MTEDNNESYSDTGVKFAAILTGWPWIEILAEAWKIGKKILRGLSNEGICKILEWENPLELLDQRGRQAIFKKREKVRFLQDHVIAYQDEAWGDERILDDYKCSPGVEVDRYRLGYKTYRLISLRSVKNKGDQEEFNIVRKIANGFPRKAEQWETYEQRQPSSQVRRNRKILHFNLTRRRSGQVLWEESPAGRYRQPGKFLESHPPQQTGGGS